MLLRRARVRSRRGDLLSVVEFPAGADEVLRGDVLAEQGEVLLLSVKNLLNDALCKQQNIYNSES